MFHYIAMSPKEYYLKINILRCTLKNTKITAESSNVSFVGFIIRRQNGETLEIKQANKRSIKCSDWRTARRIKC